MIVPPRIPNSLQSTFGLDGIVTYYASIRRLVELVLLNGLYNCEYISSFLPFLKLEHRN